MLFGFLLFFMLFLQFVSILSLFLSIFFLFFLFLLDLSQSFFFSFSLYLSCCFLFTLNSLLIILLFLFSFFSQLLSFLFLCFKILRIFICLGCIRIQVFFNFDLFCALKVCDLKLTIISYRNGNFISILPNNFALSLTFLWFFTIRYLRSTRFLIGSNLSAFW